MGAFEFVYLIPNTNFSSKAKLCLQIHIMYLVINSVAHCCFDKKYGSQYNVSLYLEQHNTSVYCYFTQILWDLQIYGKFSHTICKEK